MAALNGAVIIAPMPSQDLDVCLSFAGENRQYVERVAAALRTAGVRFFYDSYEQVSLWGKDLYQHLDDVYRKRAAYCVVFISRAYAQKLWTKHELNSAQARAFQENREYILPVRLDDTQLPGVLPTTGYVSDKSPEELAELIVKKLQQGSRFSSVTCSSSLAIGDLAQQMMLQNGSSATAKQRAAFVSVWSSLVALEEAGQELWKRVSGEALAAFADRYREAKQNITAHGIFFSEPDYRKLEEIMRAADFYLDGKTNLSDIYNGRVGTHGANLTEPTERDTFMDQDVRAQIRQNRRWLTRYQKLLRTIRAHLYANQYGRTETRDTLKRSDFERINRGVAVRFKRALRSYHGRDVTFGKLTDLVQGQIFVLKASPLLGEDVDVAFFAFTNGNYVNRALDVDLFFDIVENAGTEFGYLLNETEVFDELRNYLAEFIYAKASGKYIPYVLLISTGLKVEGCEIMDLSDSLISFSVNSRLSNQFQVDGISHSRSTFAKILADPRFRRRLEEARRRSFAQDENPPKS